MDQTVLKVVQALWLVRTSSGDGAGGDGPDPARCVYVVSTPAGDHITPVTIFVGQIMGEIRDALIGLGGETEIDKAVTEMGVRAELVQYELRPVGVQGLLDHLSISVKVGLVRCVRRQRYVDGIPKTLAPADLSLRASARIEPFAVAMQGYGEHLLVVENVLGAIAVMTINIDYRYPFDPVAFL
jgi:hypothetical protein